MRALQPGWRDLKTTAKDGRMKDVAWANIALPDGRTIGIGIDVCERKAAEDKLRTSEEPFQKTFKNAPVGIAHFAPDGRWLWVNDKLCETVGYTRAELFPKDLC